ncbi:acyltransferase family protein [Paeniglutamicibacter sp.]|uniref:acyltransferase family protein n=1 Tax=Paeniglutamicibacter sp. TaxID=1934391 RepID=UPI0039897DA1
MLADATMQADTGVAAKAKNSFRADIQGLRAVAVLLVVAYHSGVDWVSGGYAGVDVFFVISGFLITGHLLRSLEHQGRIRFGAFYAKRARRILPAAMLVALVTTVASWIWMPPLLMQEDWKGAVATALYMPNVLFARHKTDYLSESAPSVFQHYWSLGIEEQFYLFWPAILALGFWVLRRNRIALLGLVLTLTLASFALCLVGMNSSQPWTFFSLPTRAWELGVGALLAFHVRSNASWLKRPVTGVLAWVGLVSLILIGFNFDSSTPFPGPYAAFPVLATALLIIGGGSQGRFSSDRVLGLRLLQFVGKISYSLYLVHWPMQAIPLAMAGPHEPLSLSVRLMLGLISFPLAWLLYRWVEMPAIRFRARTQGQTVRTLLASFAASGLVVAIAFGAGSASNSAQLSTDDMAIEGPLVAAPTGTPFIPLNMEPSLRLASQDNPKIYSSGCHRVYESTDSSGCQVGSNKSAPLVFLFGDSHAANWYPALAALAERGDIRLDSNTKSSCHSVDKERFVNGVEYFACDTWRAGVIDRINIERPNLVLIANYGKSTLVSEAPFHTSWQEGLKRTLDAIAPVPVAVIADVPDNKASLEICLSAHIDDVKPCVLPRSEQLVAATAAVETAAAASAGATFVDFSSYLCNEDSCPPIIGNKLVYRDAHHLTATFSRSMSDIFWEKIGPLLK